MTSLFGHHLVLIGCIPATGFFHLQISFLLFLFFACCISGEMEMYVSQLTICTLTYSSVWGVAVLPASGFLIIPLLAWSPESLHNWQTCKSKVCKNSWVSMRVWQSCSEECNSVTERVWTLRRQHIPGVGQWEAHSVHCRVACITGCSEARTPCCRKRSQHNTDAKKKKKKELSCLS